MVVVVLIAGGALVALRAYNNAAPETLEDTLFTIQQGTAVVAAICAAIFAVITALKQAKPPGFSLGASSSLPAQHSPLQFGRAAALASGAT